MLRIASCIVYEHDLILVGLAAVICTLGSLVSVRLIQRTTGSRGYARLAWAFIGALAAGSTIWCTHFVAMLAYDPGTGFSLDPMLTFASLVIAIGGCAVSMFVASIKARFAAATGGGLFGISVSAMHYTGMAAFSVSGLMNWDAAYIYMSVAMAIGFGALTFALGSSARKYAALEAATTMVLAIVLLHFTGMAAIEVTPFLSDIGQTLIGQSRNLLVMAVTGVSLVILGTGAISFFLDDQSRAHLALRIRHMSESAVDGMAVVRDGRIVEANAAFLEMSGLSREELLGQSISGLIEDPSLVTEGELVCTNLLSRDGSLVPVELAVRTEHVSGEAKPLSVYAFRDISQRLQHEEHISYLATFDSLTGLRNRSSFLKEAVSMLYNREEQLIAALALDLDRFKDINDIHGHAAGDHVLQTLGARIREYLGQGQVAARMGGDEFVIFTTIETREDARTLTEEIIACISTEIEFGSMRFRCNPSVGIALCPSDGTTVSELMNNADLAMYRAKQQASGSYCFYNREMDDAVRERRALIDDLRNAIETDELELHYQVQVSVPTETVTGYEALARWKHPTKGMIPPNEFIPLAEQSGLIGPLGEWVLRTACNEAASWPVPNNVAVNLSPAQLAIPDFSETVLAILMETGLSPSRLELEVTETSFINDQSHAVAVLGKLKAMGISVSIDDFGTGYSSLAMLREFPFDKIKLDKSLVDEVSQNRKAQGIFRAVLSLGDALAVPVLAEGVETSEQLEYLRANGCTLVQGYYYGKPQRHAVWNDRATATKDDEEPVYPRKSAGAA